MDINSTSDGCSGGVSSAWKFFTGKDPIFSGCCRDHDREYDLGGTPEDRYIADLDFFKCVYEYSPIWAYIMFFAVRIFGAFHWGWKWNKYDYTIED